MSGWFWCLGALKGGLVASLYITPRGLLTVVHGELNDLDCLAAESVLRAGLLVRAVQRVFLWRLLVLAPFVCVAVALEALD